MQRSWAAPFLSVGFAVLLASCREQSGATEASASREPVGVVLADVPGDPVARIYGFGTHPDGYFLLDGPAARVLLIGRDGRVSRSLGRHGGAPGEFRDASLAIAAADGRLAVLDPPFITVFKKSGEVRARFMTRPTLGPLDWACNDSLLVFAGHGDLAPGSKVPALEFFRDDGTPVGASAAWPRWSPSMNNSIAGLAFSERDCVITAMEAVGRQYAVVDLRADTQAIEPRDVPWPENPAEVMTAAVNAGSDPVAAGKLVSRNTGIWRVAGDTVLVRQDSTSADLAVSFRYRLVVNGVGSSSDRTDLKIWEADADSISFTRVRDDGTIEVGRASIRWLLDPLRKALPRGTR